MEIALNSPCSDGFFISDADGVPMSGLVAGNFSIKLYDPTGNISAQTVSIAELSGGYYRQTFTPNGTGSWTVLVIHTGYEPLGLQATYECTETRSRVSGTYGKLPTEYIMGSSVLTSMDNEINDISGGMSGLSTDMAELSGAISGMTAALEGIPDDFGAVMVRVAGLSQHNFSMSGITYNDNERMTTGTVTLWTDETHTTPVTTYTVHCEYDLNGNMIYYEQMENV